MNAAVAAEGLSLLDPWLLTAAPLVLLALWWRLRQPRAAAPTAAVSLFAGAPRTLRQRLAFVPLSLKVLAGLLLVLALARPVEREVVPLEEEGIDIVLVVDTSSSMITEDMRPNQAYRRMDAARERAEQFAAARVHDRLALVAFARFAELRCPPTLDEQALAAFLRGLDTVPQGSVFDATAIGTALGKAVEVLQKSDAKSKVVVLLSDGENTPPQQLPDQVLPEDAARLAKDAGVRVHTIGLGAGRPGLFGAEPLTFAALKTISETTGGRFFQPKDDDDLGEVYRRIDELEKTAQQDPRYRTVDRFEWPLGAGLAALLLAVLAEALLIRRLP
ncbi:MAG: VWA domain-containing protein [Planctomycetes bacterium]|nr:VWA domain-containing protein [Planctomycetota bacterium]